jgi:hypothetical protein
MAAVSITGCVLVVSSSASLGPSWMSRGSRLRPARPRPRPASASHGGVVAPGVEHAHGLRALAGKDKCKCAHGFGLGVQVATAQKSSSTAPQVKPPPTPSSITVSHASRGRCARRRPAPAASTRPRCCRVHATVTTSLSSGQLQLARRALHDADVGLVRNQPVQVGLGAAGLFKHGTRAALSSTPTASLNTAWPSILSSGSPSTCPPDTVPGTHRMPTWRPSACRSVARMPGLGAGFQHHGAGAVAKQHAGGAVVEIQDAREDLGAHHQRATCGCRRGPWRPPPSGRRQSRSTRPACRTPGSPPRPACAAGCRRWTGTPCPAWTWPR